MDILLKAILLFGLNVLDALLTLIWIESGIAEEGNGLMAYVLSLGETIFLFVKTSIGLLGILVFYHWSHLMVAKIGVTLALGIYLALMGIHAATGMAAIIP